MCAQIVLYPLHLCTADWENDFKNSKETFRSMEYWNIMVAMEFGAKNQNTGHFRNVYFQYREWHNG